MYSGFLQKKVPSQDHDWADTHPRSPNFNVVDDFQAAVVFTRMVLFYATRRPPPEITQTNVEVGVARGTAPITRMMRWYFISQKPGLEFKPLGTCQRRSRLPQWGHHAAFKCGGDKKLFVELTNSAARAQASMQ